MGVKWGGATRWIQLSGISIQPSEFLKLSVIVFLSSLLSANKKQVQEFFTGFIPLVLLSILLSLPVLLQPDLGTTLTILGTTFLLLFYAGAQVWHLNFLFFSGGITVAIISYFSSYRLRRLTAFINPWADPLGSGYQIIQSKIAVSSGHLIGLGLGNSKQKFLYLPQQYSDFIFAIVCEELGLIGTALFLVVLVAFLARGVVVLQRIKDDYARLLGIGIVSLFALQAFLNIAVVLGLVPTTGLPLPFISYGGSSIVVNLFAAGIVANISKK
ncbi:FtsW/RodA/SpoVE family cell cycle protein [Candidatus Margulisiibacteriota bacterium]